MKKKGQEIKEMSFETYLTEIKKFSVSTSKEYVKHKNKLLSYLENECLSIENLIYKDLITFISWKQKQGYNKPYINVQLSAIKHYLDYLTEKEILPCNVGSGLFMRGRHQSVPSGF